jgi:hypothetical protein
MIEILAGSGPELGGIKSLVNLSSELFKVVGENMTLMLWNFLSKSLKIY